VTVYSAIYDMDFYYLCLTFFLLDHFYHTLLERAENKRHGMLTYFNLLYLNVVQQFQEV